MLKTGWARVKEHTVLRACLAQLNFTSKAVFLENSIMSDFLDEAELFWRKCLTK